MTSESAITAEIKKHYYDVAPGSSFEKDKADTDFWLGPVVSGYEIAEYGFVEYRETDFKNGPNYGKLTGRTRFSIYINGHSVGRSGGCLDHALVIAIAYKRNGQNSQAAEFFWRMTQPDSTESD